MVSVQCESTMSSTSSTGPDGGRPFAMASEPSILRACWVLFAIGSARARIRADRKIKHALWIGPWFAGQVLIGALGRYGGGRNIIPDWVDIAVVVAFALAIFYWAVSLTLSSADAAEAIAKDAHQLDTLQL